METLPFYSELISRSQKGCKTAWSFCELFMPFQKLYLYIYKCMLQTPYLTPPDCDYSRWMHENWQKRITKHRPCLGFPGFPHTPPVLSSRNVNSMLKFLYLQSQYVELFHCSKERPSRSLHCSSQPWRPPSAPHRYGCVISKPWREQHDSKGFAPEWHTSQLWAFLVFSSKQYTLT